MLLITHDPHLVELIADRLWLVADGTVRPFDGDLDDYRALLAERSRAAPKPDAGNRRDERRERADARAALAPLRKQARDAEARLARLAAERATIETNAGRSLPLCSHAQGGDRCRKRTTGHNQETCSDRRGGVACGGRGAGSGFLRIIHRRKANPREGRSRMIYMVEMALLDMARRSGMGGVVHRSSASPAVHPGHSREPALRVHPHCRRSLRRIARGRWPAGLHLGRVP